MPAVSDGAVPFVEAIAYLRDRLAISDSEWQALLRAAGARADTVVDEMAESMRRDMLAAALEIFETGGSALDFKARYQEIAGRYGWATPSDPGWHSNLVWRMETFGARAAGRWEQAQRLQAARPGTRYFFRYVTAGDHRVRVTHQEWHGIVLPIGHAFWRTHFPPNGFNCRCHVQIVTERDIVRYGWQITADDDPRLAVTADDGFASNVGMAWSVLRGGEPLPPTRPAETRAERVAVVVRDAALLPSGYTAELGTLAENARAWLGAEARAVEISAETIRTHRHHPEATAEAYARISAELLGKGMIVADPDAPRHLRLVGTVDGAVWAAVVKVDRSGRLWLVSLHRSNPRQMRRWARGVILRLEG